MRETTDAGHCSTLPLRPTPEAPASVSAHLSSGSSVSCQQLSQLRSSEHNKSKQQGMSVMHVWMPFHCYCGVPATEHSSTAAPFASVVPVLRVGTQVAETVFVSLETQSVKVPYTLEELMEEELQQKRVFVCWKQSLSCELHCWMLWRGEVEE